MRIRLVPAALLVLSCAHGQRPAGDQNFLQLESDHFILRTDLPLAEARPALIELERVRVALLTASWHGSRPPEEKLSAVLLADSEELSQFARPGVAGYVGSDVFGARTQVTSAEQSPSQLPVLKHELAHALNRAFLLREPRWLSEGLACYLETLRLDFAENRFILGEPSRERLRFLQINPVMDYRRVLEMGPEALTLSPEQGYAFESAAWLLVHYLANERRPQLDDFIQRLARAEDPAAALLAAFPGMTEEGLAREVNNYLQHGRFGTVTIALPDYASNVKVRSLPPAEAHAIRAELYLESVGRNEAQRGRALAEAKAALALDPANPLALGVLEKVEGKKSAEGARAAVKEHPEDWRSFWLLAEAAPTADPAGRRAALEEAARLAPLNAAVQNALAWQYAAKGEGALALPLAARAVELAPGSPVYLDTLALALGAAGRCEEAVLTERRALEVLPDGAGPQAADDLRARIVRLQSTCQKRAPVVVQTEPRRKQCQGTGPLLTARQRRAGARISVELTLSPEASLEEVALRAGNAQLLGPVRDWLRSCKFEPATEGGRPVESHLVLEFDLEK